MNNLEYCSKPHPIYLLSTLCPMSPPSDGLLQFESSSLYSSTPLTPDLAVPTTPPGDVLLSPVPMIATGGGHLKFGHNLVRPAPIRQSTSNALCW